MTGTGFLDPPTPPPKKKIIKGIWFLSKTELDPLKKHKATKRAFNVGPSSSRQGNAVQMAFRWRADDGPFIVAF